MTLGKFTHKEKCMSQNKIITPESLLKQKTEDEMWQKYVGLLLFKLAPQGVTLTLEDLKKMSEAQDLVVLVRGRNNNVEFSLVTPEKAEMLAIQEQTHTGNL